ncbi:MAG TPA: hypothetical protein VFC63_02820 [Blastocatellia bacterium]|nr:hypothetical protein [Blastocatellia bacterium]
MFKTFLPSRRKFKGICLLMMLMLGLTQLRFARTHSADDKDKDATKKAADDKSNDKSKSAKPAPTPEELQQMLIEQSKAMEALQQQVRQQQAEIDALKSKSTGNQPANAASVTPTLGTNANTTASATTSTTANTTAPIGKTAVPPQETSPLQLRIGNATIQPIGFMDFTAVVRGTNTGNNIGTNFNSIPFNNQEQGHLSEARLSMQNSRIGFRVDALVHDARVIGYMEADFLGNNPNNTFVSSNSNTLRSRLYWVDVTRDKFEVMGGQSWSLMTPGKNGISPLPGDIFYTQNIDVNYQIGLTWARQAGIRFVYHPTNTVAAAIALENPEQFVGNPAEVTFPSAFNAVLTGGNPQFDSGGALSTPNLHPDIIGKVAWDPKVGDRHFHVEGVGFLRTFKNTFIPVGGTTFDHSTKTGGGGALNMWLDVTKNIHYVSTMFFSDGGGRYIFGQAPDAVVHPDGSIGLVQSYSTIQGIEANVRPNTLLFAYYGGMYAKRNTFIDTTSGLAVKPFIGFGGPNSGTSNNRAIQEGTFGFNQTIWKDPKWGAVNFMGQFSYLTRAPWFVAPGAPKNAHTPMIFLNLRYTLPGSAPKKEDLTVNK